MNLSDIQHGIVDRPSRIILAGVEKIGKSTFASQAPSPIFLPIRGEEGIDALNVSRFPVCSSFAEVMDSLGVLASEKTEFKTIVIDSVSTLESLIWDQTCKDSGVDGIEKVGGGYGKGYIEAVKCWRELMSALDYLRDKGIGSILIAHVAVKSFSDPAGENYDTWELDINKKAVSALLRWSDAILFANCKVYTKTTQEGMKTAKKGILKNERVLFTQKRPAHPGGGRGIFGQLPYEIDLSYAAWQAAINEAKGGIK